MAWTLGKKRWTIPFVSYDGEDCRIDIYKRGYNGNTVTTLSSENLQSPGIPADDPFYYEEDNSRDLLNDVLRYRTGYIRIYENILNGLDDLYPKEWNDRYVEFFYGSHLDFNGYIQVQDFSNKLQPTPNLIELPIISPLGLFNKNTFSVILPPTAKTIGELLDVIFGSVIHPQCQKVILPFYLGVDFSMKVNSLVVSPWNEDYHHSMNVSPMSKVMKPETFDTLIEGICKAFGWVCHDTPQALIFTVFDYTAGYGNYPVGHIGDNNYFTLESNSSGTANLSLYFNPADSDGNVSRIQPDTGIEIDYDGESGNIDFSFDRSYFADVVTMPGMDLEDGERFSLCNLVPVPNCWEMSMTGVARFDQSGFVIQGAFCVAWNGYKGILVSVAGTEREEYEMFWIRLYRKKVNQQSWNMNYEGMVSQKYISALKSDDTVMNEHVRVSIDKTNSNYITARFYYKRGFEALPTGYLLYFTSIDFEMTENNVPYGEYQTMPADKPDIIPTGSVPSSTVTMPISLYRKNDRLIGDGVWNTKLTEYPYMLSQRTELIERFRNVAYRQNIFHARRWSYLDINWRIIALSFYPWNDEFKLTLESGITSTDPSPTPPGPEPPGPEPTPTPQMYSDILDAMNTVLQRNSISTIADDSKADKYLKYMFNEAELEWKDSGSALFSTDTYPELYPIHGNISLYQDTAHTAMHSWLMAMCLSELVPTSGDNNVQTQLFKCAYDLGGGASVPIYGSYTMRGDVNIARLAAAAVYHSLHDIYAENGMIADCRSQLGNHTIQADDWEGLGNTRQRNPDRSTGQPAIGYDVLSNGYVVNAEKFLLSTPGPRVAGTYAASRPLPYGDGKQPASMFNSDSNYTLDASVDSFMVSNYNMMAQTPLSTWQGYNTEKRNRLVQVGAIPMCTKMYMFGLQIPVKLHLDNGQLPIVQGYPRYVFEQDFASNTLHLDGPFSDLSNLYHFVTVEATDPAEAASEIQSKRLPFEKWLDSVTDIADNARWPVYNPNYGRRRPGCNDSIAGGPRSDTPGAAENEIYNVSLTQMSYDDSFEKKRHEDEDGFASDPPASYPSGHSAQIYTLALMLGQMDPTRITRWMRRAYEYAEGRSIGRFHWYSDVMYGRLFATMTTPILNAMNGSTFKAGYEATKASVLRGTTVISINIRIRNNTANYVSLDGDLTLILDNTGTRKYGWLGIYNRASHIRFSNESLRMNPGESKTFYNITWSDSADIYVNGTLTDQWVIGLKGQSPLDSSMLPSSYPRNVLLYQGGDSSIVMANNFDHSIVFAEGQTYDIIIS